MYFLTIPNSVSTIEYRFYRQPNSLVNDNDIPDIPPPFTQILVWDALISMAAYNTDINPAHIAIWTKNRTDLETQMIAALEESNSLDAEPRYVRYTDSEQEGLPRIYGS